MSATTTIRLSNELKARLSRAAERAGTTSHGFILKAIEEKTEQEERQADFHDVADQRYAHFIDSGESIPWTDMRRYLEQRMTGKPAKRPVPKKLAR